jgi:hypothetical protein
VVSAMSLQQPIEEASDHNLVKILVTRWGLWSTLWPFNSRRTLNIGQKRDIPVHQELTWRSLCCIIYLQNRFVQPGIWFDSIPVFGQQLLKSLSLCCRNRSKVLESREAFFCLNVQQQNGQFTSIVLEPSVPFCIRCEVHSFPESYSRRGKKFGNLK